MYLCKVIAIIIISIVTKCVLCDEQHIIYDYLGLPEGSKCSWQGVDGVCAKVYNCLSAMEDFRQKNYPPFCSFQGVKPIICCTDCELGEVSPLLINPGVPFWLYKSGEKARDHCLDYLDQYNYSCIPEVLVFDTKVKHPEKNCYNTMKGIVGAAGGRNANRDQFRHMALLGYGADMDSAQWLCGGSLISNKFILTAGHCISSPRIGSVRYAALGILKRTDPLELWQRYYIKRIVRHPEYSPPSKYHDIALLETTSQISFNVHVLPACLQFTGESPHYAHASGWGMLGNRRELADTLQYVYLNEFEEQECAQAYPRHRHLRHGYNHTTQMCYGNRDKIADTCEGDSGGPLQSQYYVSQCIYTIIGITSAGRSCDIVGSSGMYTRVIHYVPWIESVVWPDEVANV